MEYTDNETEEKYYIEVKTNGSSLPNISFNLTVTERNFAENNDHWKVYIVTNPYSDTPDINYLTWQSISSYANTPAGFWVEFAIMGL